SRGRAQQASGRGRLVTSLSVALAGLARRSFARGGPPPVACCARPGAGFAAPCRTSDEENDAVAVKLRLMRMGKKKQPTYRIVAADSRSPRDGRFIEIVGTYQPRAEPSAIRTDNARGVRWLRRGATPPEPVEKLLRISGAWEQFASGPSAS